MLELAKLRMSKGTWGKVTLLSSINDNTDWTLVDEGEGEGQSFSSKIAVNKIARSKWWGL